MLDYFLLLISAVFVNNVVLAQYLGQCPYLGCSKEKGVSIGMGAAVIFVMIIATPITWLIQAYILLPLGLDYLQTIMFILVIGALVQLVEMFLKKAIPPLYSSLGIFLPLITTNCAVLGVAIVVQRESFDLGTSTYYSFATGLGFLLALVLLAAIRERLDISRLPLSMRGVPAALVMAGIMSMSFLAFSGMI